MLKNKQLINLIIFMYTFVNILSFFISFKINILFTIVIICIVNFDVYK